MRKLIARPLTADAFAPFGEVIDLRTANRVSINRGLTARFNNLFTIDVDGAPMVSVFRTSPLPLPHRVRVLERHPRGSQAFMPMDDKPFLVLVAADAAKIRADDMKLFITDGKQGVNIYKNTWHHFQIVPQQFADLQRDFIVVDRGGDDNLEEMEIDDEIWIAPIGA